MFCATIKPGKRTLEAAVKAFGGFERDLGINTAVLRARTSSPANGRKGPAALVHGQ